MGELVQLHVNDDGTITSPYGDVGDLEPCVAISGWIVDALQGRDAPLCTAATKMLGPGSARVDGDMMTVDARDSERRYRLHPAEWDDGAGRITTEQFYLGVLQGD